MDDASHRRRAVLHIDMDAFFASVEQRDHPELRGKPLIIAGLERRGVVSTASYEARVFGVHSAMPTARAKQLCPDGVFMPPNHSKYSAVSRQVFEIFERYTPEIEGLSLDEAFLDVTASLRLLGSPNHIAQRIKSDIFDVTGLRCSVGIAHNKLLAKLATEMGKPDGLFSIIPSEVQSILAPLPIGKMWTVGKVTAAKLAQIGVHTIRDFNAAPMPRLQKAIGNHALTLKALCAGIDDRPVERAREDLSLSAETTVDLDLKTLPEAEALLMKLCERVGARARQQHLLGKVVTVKLRKPPFDTSTRQLTLPEATQTTRAIYDVAQGLLRKWWSAESKPALRLLGVSLSRLQTAEVDTASMFEDLPAKKSDQLVDQINAKFGKMAIRRAKSLDSDAN